MKFLLLVIADPHNDRSETPPLSIEEWGAEVDRRGVRQEGDRLRPPAHARTVRRRGGDVLVTDGPFAETHEWIGGFDVLECADLDEALELAAQHPMATHGAIEVRAAWPLS